MLHQAGPMNMTSTFTDDFRKTQSDKKSKKGPFDLPYLGN